MRNETRKRISQSSLDWNGCSGDFDGNFCFPIGRCWLPMVVNLLTDKPNFICRLCAINKAHRAKSDQLIEFSVFQMKENEIDYLRITVFNFHKSIPRSSWNKYSACIFPLFIIDRSHSEFRENSPCEKDLCRYWSRFICIEIEFRILTRWKFMENIH